MNTASGIFFFFELPTADCRQLKAAKFYVSQSRNYRVAECGEVNLV